MSRKRWMIGSVLIAMTLITLFVVIHALWKDYWDKHELVLYGNVDVRQVDISFRVPGQVSRLLCEEGDIVTTGCLLATLDPSPYNSQLEQAEGNLKTIQANYQNAEQLFLRRQELLHIHGISVEDFQTSQANYLALAASLQAAEAALQVAVDNLSYTQVFAPTDGVILTRIREPGTVVNPTDPVYTVSIASPVWVRAYVAEPDLGKICYGMEATVFTDTKHGPSYKGKIGFISPMAEFTPKTVETTQLRTDLVYRLRIYIDQPDCGLKQGMPVTVNINFKDQCEALSH